VALWGLALAGSGLAFPLKKCLAPPHVRVRHMRMNAYGAVW
jgi:hypothetical protein